MKSARVRALLFVAGVLLIVWGVVLRQSVPVAAAPSMLITETPTSEPPSPTPRPTDAPAASPSPTSPPPTSTSVPPTNTPPPPPPPTSTPEPDDGDREPRPTATATPEPTATLTPTPIVTPTVAPALGPDPAVTKSVSPPSAIVGQTVVYTIQVTNLGDVPATGVVVEDTLPSFLSIVDVTATRGTVTTSGQSVRVEIGDLAPGEVVEVRISARVRAPSAAPNNVNLAVVSSTSPDSNLENNRASVALDAGRPAVLPNTADEPWSPLPVVATTLGLALVAGSILMGRSARSTRRRRG
jgi:uncharacterized repeat protein (TIGR01451 family)